jgi:hypothetical protein
MTVSTIVTRVEYTGTGSTVTFTYPFRILSAVDLEVSINGIRQTLTTQYTVAGVDDPAGGTVTFVTAPAAGTSILLDRHTAPTQLMNLVDHDPQPAETVERAHDKAILLIQELETWRQNLIVEVESGAVGPGMGQCYLSYENANSLWLMPQYGNKIWVAGRSRVIPDAGIRLAPTGLTPHTNYYIYVTWIGSALVLEASVTGWAQTGGLWHKADDLSRTLVGYARCLEEGTAPGVPIWLDSENIRGVLSLYNQDERVGTAKFTAPRSTTTSAAPVELHQEIRCYFIAWGFTNITMTLTGTAYSTVGFSSYLVLDEVAIAGTYISPTAADVHLNIATGIAKSLPPADTLHVLTMYGQVWAPGTATWWGDPNDIEVCRTGFTLAT